MFPFRARTWTRRRTHLISAAFWVLNVLAPWQVRNIFFAGADAIFFVYFKYSCDFDTEFTSAPKWLDEIIYVSLAFNNITTNLLLIVTTVWLLMIARRTALQQNGSLRWQGVLPVTLTAVVYVTSSFPLAWVIVTKRIVPYSELTWAIVSSLQNINIMANFFIYSLTIRSFRDFLKTTIRSTVSKVIPCRRLRRVNRVGGEGSTQVCLRPANGDNLSTQRSSV
jgi:hypothetical protein